MKNSLISRAHNKIELKKGWVYKTSETNFEKLFEEYKWFQRANDFYKQPETKKLENGYKIKFIKGDNLGEVFWSFSLELQKGIIDSYMCMLKGSIVGNKNNVIKDLMRVKFKNRVSVIPDIFRSSLMEEINFYNKNIIKICKKVDNSLFWNVMHGDMFFGNSIWNEEGIHMIDPRGIEEGADIFGNVFYDIIKLAHSVHGKYDRVIFKESNVDNTEISKYFFMSVKKEFNLDKKDVLIGEMGLFISMLPIHSDSSERQRELLNISKNIYQEIL